MPCVTVSMPEMEDFPGCHPAAVHRQQSKPVYDFHSLCAEAAPQPPLHTPLHYYSSSSLSLPPSRCVPHTNTGLTLRVVPMVSPAAQAQDDPPERRDVLLAEGHPTVLLQLLGARGGGKVRRTAGGGSTEAGCSTKRGVAAAAAAASAALIGAALSSGGGGSGNFVAGCGRGTSRPATRARAGERAGDG